MRRDLRLSRDRPCLCRGLQLYQEPFQAGVGLLDFVLFPGGSWLAWGRASLASFLKAGECGGGDDHAHDLAVHQPFLSSLALRAGARQGSSWSDRPARVWTGPGLRGAVFRPLFHVSCGFLRPLGGLASRWDDAG